jgi:hypothetical protein
VVRGIFYNHEYNFHLTVFRMVTITKFDRTIDIIGVVNLLAISIIDIPQLNASQAIKYIALIYIAICAILYIVLMITRWHKLTQNKKSILPLGTIANVLVILFFL